MNHSQLTALVRALRLLDAHGEAATGDTATGGDSNSA